jgi:hypothetical protein
MICQNKRGGEIMPLYSRYASAESGEKVSGTFLHPFSAKKLLALFLPIRVSKWEPPMSDQRDRFETEVRGSQPNWEKAVDNLSALAMFEMLPALAGLPPATRAEVVNHARTILSDQRGWRGAFERIDFAADVVNDRRLTSWLSSVPDNQVEDARNFLTDLLKPTRNQAGRAGFTDDRLVPSTVGLSSAIATLELKDGYGWTVPVKRAFVDYQPGDILTDGNHHIGMVSFDGIVQTADTPLGVIVSQNYGGTWTHHMRLSDYFWSAHGGVK